MRATCVALVALLAACGDLYDDLGNNRQDETRGTEVQRDRDRDRDLDRTPTSVTERESGGSTGGTTGTTTGTTPGTTTGTTPGTTGTTPGTTGTTPGTMPGTTTGMTGQELNQPLTVRVAGTREYPNLRGTIELRPMGDHVEVMANIDGLPAGKHAIHVHERGDCTDPKGKSMGDHLDFSKLTASTGGSTGTTTGATGTGTTTSPTGMPPGGTTGTGTTGTKTGTTGTTPGTTGTTGTTGTAGTTAANVPAPTVLGNLGDLDAKANLPAKYTATIPGLTVGNLNGLVGRAIAIHEKANDPTKADGNAGDAIACGVIGVPRPGAAPEG